jgi:ligand-binding SRPBCC domain-containing protein
VGRVYTLEREQWVPRSPDQMFLFFSDARNLEKITPPWLSFRVVSVAPEPIVPGTLIHYRLRVRGIPFRWTTKITEWNPPHSFIDIELSGPYAQWIHTHRFEARNGGTLLTDRVEYALPLGFLGRIAHGLLVKRDVEGIFDYRRQKIEEMFR